jgi:hypothetical protein
MVQAVERSVILSLQIQVRQGQERFLFEDRLLQLIKRQANRASELDSFDSGD